MVDSIKRILKGVTLNRTSKAYNGFTLFAPLGAKMVRLIDMKGRTVHKWDTPYSPGLYGELLPNGNLLYSGHIENGPLSDLEGAGGELIEMDWDGNIVWSYKDPYLHHSFYRMLNGHTIVLKWVRVPKDVAIKVKGGIPGTERNGIMWGDLLQEITPKGKVIWEWLSYEHLNPETDVICPVCPRDQWTETTSCYVLPNNDILLSFKRINTVCIIEKTTGNIKWKWGPGELGHQNSATLTENGNILLFDNGFHANGDHFNFSRVIEIDPVTNKMEWEYRDEVHANVNFFSSFMSNTQRLPNGNTLICEAQTGRIFEVNRKGEIVWEFVNPSYSFDPLYGHNNVVPRAYRYGPNYEGLKERNIE